MFTATEHWWVVFVYTRSLLACWLAISITLPPLSSPPSPLLSPFLRGSPFPQTLPFPSETYLALGAIVVDSCRYWGQFFVWLLYFPASISPRFGRVSVPATTSWKIAHHRERLSYSSLRLGALRNHGIVEDLQISATHYVMWHCPVSHFAGYCRSPHQLNRQEQPNFWAWPHMTCIFCLSPSMKWSRLLSLIDSHTPW